MASRAHPSASSAVSPKMTSLGSSAIVSTTPDDPIGSMLITYLFAMVRLPPFVVVTSAGVSAGIDMALHLVGRLWGAELARAVQKAVEYFPDPPYADVPLPVTLAAR